jgi:hypothetical protein
MKNKRAQGMSTSTIILLILGLIILVVLVLGFTTGWNKFAPFLSKNNLEGIKNACTIACSTNNAYDFCSVKREVKDGINPKFESTCKELSTNPSYLSRGYAIDECPNLC